MIFEMKMKSFLILDMYFDFVKVQSGEPLEMNLLSTYSRVDSNSQPACHGLIPGRIRLPWLQIALV